MKSVVSSVLFFCLPLVLFGTVQIDNTSTTIQGKVIDANSGITIPYCGIKVMDQGIGTASNELGEFELKVDAIPVTLTFSHINYEDFSVTVTSAEEILIIELNPLLNLLETVVIETPKLKNDPNASKLAKRVYRKVSSRLNSELKYGKAFYRQKTKTNELFTEFSEILFDAEYNGGGILKWDILEGRYALNEAGINNKNYTRLSQILKGFQPETDDIIFPLHPELEEHYYVNFKDRYTLNDDEIVILKFTPINPLETPIFRGEAYINTTTDELLKLSCVVRNDKLDLVSLTEKKATKKNYMLGFDLVFKQDKEHGHVLDYLKVDQEFDYYKDDVLIGQVSSTSNLTFIEHYTSDGRKKLGRQFRRNNSDWENLDQIGYNKEYWDNNPIVKRTPIEKEVIEAFEKDNAFESIFLNSKDEITVIQSRISEDGVIQKVDSLLGIYNSDYPVEKVYLHTDKNSIVIGDNLWYSAYVTIGPLHNYSVASKTLYVSLLDDNGDAVLSQKKILYDGTSIGHFSIGKDIPEGHYELRAYTNWIKDNYPDQMFRKTISIENPLLPETSDSTTSDLDIQFLPEGGYAIAGLRNRIAFRVCDESGLSRAISGQITDAEGNFVTRFQSNSGGMGSFTMLPVAGKKYVARLDNGQEYELPEMLSSGFNLFANNLNPSTVQVRIQASAELRDQEIYLIGSVRNYKFFQGKYNLRNRPFIDIEIPKNRFPTGVLTLTLIDDQMRPWCERIVFVNHNNSLKIETNVRNSAHKDSLNLDITVRDSNDLPVATNLSLALTNADRIYKEASNSNILSYLLLESDLKGGVISPNMFFMDTSRRAQFGLDMVMLTHGWRKFNWLASTKSNLNVDDFQFKDSYDISGIARSKDGKELANTTLDLIVKSSEELQMYTTETDDNGSFSFTNLIHVGATELTFNAYNANRKSIEIDITLAADSAVPMSAICVTGMGMDTQTILMEEGIDQQYLNNVIEFDTTQEGVTALDEVVVEGRRLEREKLTPSFMGVEADDVIFVEEDEYNITDVLSRGTGVFVTGDQNRPKVRVQGIGDVTWVIDGVKIAANPDPGRESSIVSPTLSAMIQPKPAPIEIATLNMQTVERIEIVKGAKTSILGAHGSSAAIFIYTKKGKFYETKTIDSPKLQHEGFSVERAFYIPKYFNANDNNASPTLYWNGSVLTDNDGKATLTVPRSKTREMQLAIEALSFNGIPGFLLESIKN